MDDSSGCKGTTVFEPIGFDAFGIHSENYALKVDVHPLELIPREHRELSPAAASAPGSCSTGDHELSTTDPRYYKWTQWIFLQLLEARPGVQEEGGGELVPVRQDRARQRAGDRRRVRALRDDRSSSGSSSSGSSGSPTTRRGCSRISTGSTGRSRRRQAQRNWIGRSEGAEIVFEVRSEEPAGRGEPTRCTHPRLHHRAGHDFGATYLVLAPEHPLVEPLTTRRAARDVEAYRRAHGEAGPHDAQECERARRPACSPARTRAIPRPASAIPIWIADYVLMEYGTGAIMAVPGHDERDFEFAKKFGLPIVRVVAPRASLAPTRRSRRRTRTASVACW